MIAVSCDCKKNSLCQEAERLWSLVVRHKHNENIDQYVWDYDQHRAFLYAEVKK